MLVTTQVHEPSACHSVWPYPGSKLNFGAPTSQEPPNQSLPKVD